MMSLRSWGNLPWEKLIKCINFAHLNSQVFSLMEECRIGNLREEDVRANMEAASSAADPFANEPKRSQKLIALSIKPFNAETPFK